MSPIVGKFRRLLRVRRERPHRRRAAEERYELAAFHCPMPRVLSIERIASRQLRQETAALRHFGPIYVADGFKICRLEISAARLLYPR